VADPLLVHVDTDLGGDPDDACALAMLLGWPGVDVVGVTTNLDADGARAGCARHLLQLAGRAEIPVAVGAPESMTDGRRYAPTLGDTRYWPETVHPDKRAPGAATNLLATSVEAGATVLAIGALTNLAALERTRPGSLAAVPVVVMGGGLESPPSGYPRWGPEMDFNVQCDTEAAAIVYAAAAPTLVPLSVAIRAQLRGADLGRLRAAGPVGALLAAQSEAHRDDNAFAALARAHPALPDDLVNFLWDPVAAAVATGWEGARVEVRTLRSRRAGAALRFEEHCSGVPVRLVTEVDGDALRDRFLASIEALDRVGYLRPGAPGASVVGDRRPGGNTDG
jgi:purine nucleosidase